METLTITHATTLESGPSAPVDILISGGVIREIRPASSAERVGKIIDAAGLLITPGLINGHTHSHENFSKGRYENLPLELWMNFVRPPDPIEMTARQVYLRTMIGAIEALRTGATTIVDDLNIFPVLRPDHVEAVLQAYQDVGIRAVVCPGLFDLPFFKTTPFVNQCFSPGLIARLSGGVRTPPEDCLAYVESLMDGRHPSQERVSVALSPSAPQRCSPDWLERLRRVGVERDLPVIIHVQETRLQVVSGQMFYGQTMIEQLAAKNFLRPGVSLIHCVWLSPKEIDLIAASGATIQHNPVSNMSIGSGLAPLREMLQSGVNVSLGTDACGSSFTTSMIKTVNATALTQKLRTPDHAQWITAAEAWTAGTEGGAKALGLQDQIGALRPGMSADLLGWRLDGYAFRPLNHLLRQLVYAESGADLSLVLVDGAVVMQDSRFATIDEEAIWTEIEDVHGALLERFDAVDDDVRSMVASYDAIYRKCLEEPIDAATLPALFNTPTCGCGTGHRSGLS
jgi:guanine deaminase